MTATGQISALETDHAAASSQPARVSVLTSSRPQHIAAEPFAHLVQRECLPIEQYRELAASFPSPEAILGSRQSRMVNAAARLPAFKVLDNPAITPAWRDFFAFHTSDGFWQEIVRVFGAAIRATHPGLEHKAGKKLEAWRAGPRGMADDLDIQLDCQFVINTPWPHAANRRADRPQPPVKTAHVDRFSTLLSALFYFRDPEDQAEGGDLDFYRWNREPRFFKQRMILPRDIEFRHTVAYAANTLVAFVNSPHAAHGVTPRAPSLLPRRYINFIAEAPFHVFEANMVGPIQRLVYWPLRRRLGSPNVGGDRY